MVSEFVQASVPLIFHNRMVPLVCELHFIFWGKRYYLCYYVHNRQPYRSWQVLRFINLKYMFPIGTQGSS
jgi:hypothetical protein